MNDLMDDGYLKNDGQFPTNRLVLLRYPLAGDDPRDRSTWSWVNGRILGQCSPNEWHVNVEDDRVPENPDDWVPFRDRSELRDRGLDGVVPSN